MLDHVKGNFFETKNCKYWPHEIFFRHMKCFMQPPKWRLSQCVTCTIIAQSKLDGTWPLFPARGFYIDSTNWRAGQSALSNNRSVFSSELYMKSSCGRFFLISKWCLWVWGHIIFIVCFGSDVKCTRKDTNEKYRN